MDVLGALIPRLPDPTGELRELKDQQFFRVDLSVSRRESFSGGVERNAWYIIEAPFNNVGKFIVLTAQFRNSSMEKFKDGGGIAGTSGFDPDFGRDYSIAILEFLRDRALEQFMYQLLTNWHFDTEREI